MCRDGFKIVFEANKCVLSKYGTFVGKVMIVQACSAYPHMMMYVIRFVNNAIITDESNIWHSRLCHINFDCLSWLANMNLILKFNLVKGSKCHAYVQFKQPHKDAEARNLAPLELVHSNLCEMNGELAKGGKRYFMTFIDDCTRFCYVYLLKSKDEALYYFKT